MPLSLKGVSQTSPAGRRLVLYEYGQWCTHSFPQVLGCSIIRLTLRTQSNMSLLEGWRVKINQKFQRRAVKLLLTRVPYNQKIKILFFGLQYWNVDITLRVPVDLRLESNASGFLFLSRERERERDPVHCNTCRAFRGESVLFPTRNDCSEERHPTGKTGSFKKRAQLWTNRSQMSCDAIKRGKKKKRNIWSKLNMILCVCVVANKRHSSC